jgi:hypothetical protein
MRGPSRDWRVRCTTMAAGKGFCLTPAKSNAERRGGRAQARRGCGVVSPRPLLNLCVPLFPLGCSLFG